MYSGYSSVTSFSSVASTSTTSSRRMIIPLYNLQAHNVMTNVIVDAGTDAKVAKFMKRGLEILNLAILEPIEVFGTNSTLVNQLHAPSSARTSAEEHRDLHAYPRHPDDGSHTPASSAFSLSSGGMDYAPAATPTFRVEGAAGPTSTGPKKIFGKLFKKKDSLAPGSSFPHPSSPASSPTGSTFSKHLPTKTLSIPTGQSKRSSWLGQPQPNAAFPPDLGVGIIPVSASSNVQLQPAVLGIQPALSAPTSPPHGRPHSYAWVVRRWLKGANEGLLGNVVGLMNNMNLSDDRRHTRIPEDAQGGQVEVQFIWSRGKAAARKRRDGGEDAPSRSVSRRRSGLGSSKTPSMSSLNRSHPESPRALSPQEKRASMASDRPSVSTSAGGSEGSDSRGRRGRDHDDGDDSDPEDSETPWTCTLVVRRVPPGGGVGPRRTSSTHLDGAAVHSPAVSASDQGGPQPIRLKVATFSPTPHHPKVVSLLKIPFPLPDIVVDQLAVRKRAVSPQGIARPNWDTDAHGGLVITAEEIKDVVSSTGLWLVVREGIGGVGKVARKGDGWRIRA
ncbi:hypothetical protein FA95DRAFT_1565147 [Auriscalpium vulgare]|uniref:Uncharacterized protein n=1 Tax=Auriscalpium vulgare TaxID=40419 RepID=A0ACB8RCH5_9AGAM|nr:hypothetical protein FA95DRAFT_1565147 [Auriscalpium vulgare]